MPEKDIRKIVIFGPGPQFKGGLANYTTSLAKAFDRLPDTGVHIVSWTQQYPNIVPRDFMDRSSRTDLLEGTDIRVKYLTNYNNPLTWYRTYRYIKSLGADMVIFQWSIAIQGLPLGYISRKLYRHANTEVIFDLHFVVQKERSAIDRIFTRYGLAKAHTYIAHAYKTARELESVYPKRTFHLTEKGDRAPKGQHTVIKLYHPVYDMFTPDPEFDTEAFKRKLGLRKHVFLFFGFIRKYKGLHHAIQAFAHLAKMRDDVSLLVVGESFWQTLDASKWSTRLKQFLFGAAKRIFLHSKDDERDYRPLKQIDALGIRNYVVTVNEYVPNEDVHKYFQVSDAILLFYEFATPSGVESMAYNFKLPILAARVGHFPETVKDGYNGYLAKAGDANDMARAMQRFLDKPIPSEHVDETAQKMSWENYAKTILAGRGNRLT